MRYRLYEASTLLQLSSLNALISREPFARNEVYRVLLLSINSEHPECEGALLENSSLRESLSQAFDQVESLNTLIAPLHPSTWSVSSPNSGHRNVWLRALGLPRLDDLVLESIQVTPALSLANIFFNSDILIYSDGLMTFSPTRVKLPEHVLDRIKCVHYIDFVPGLKPLALLERRPTYKAMAPAECLAAIRDIDADTKMLPGGIVFLGQALSNSGILTAAEEVEFYFDAINAIVSAFPDCPQILFKPHGSCSSSILSALEAKAVGHLDASFEILPAEVPFESLLFFCRPRAVVGIFSTALMFAKSVFSVPVYTFGTKELIRRLPSFQNSNRIPLLLCDLLIPELPMPEFNESQDASENTAVRIRVIKLMVSLLAEELLKDLVVAVGYFMQPRNLELLRDDVLRDQTRLGRCGGPHQVYFGGVRNLGSRGVTYTATKAMFDAGDYAYAAYGACNALLRNPLSRKDLQLLNRALEALGRGNRDADLIDMLEAQECEANRSALSLHRTLSDTLRKLEELVFSGDDSARVSRFLLLSPKYSRGPRWEPLGPYGVLGWRHTLTPMVSFFVARIGNEEDVERFLDDPIGFFRRLSNPFYRRIGRLLYPWD